MIFCIGGAGCYLRHNLQFFLFRSVLLFSAQFPFCRIFAAVVIHGTFPKKRPCFVQAGLLFTAQFAKFLFLWLLFAAHFARIPGRSGGCCYPRHSLHFPACWVVIGGTFLIFVFFGFPGCYSAHISVGRDFFLPCCNAAHNFKNPVFGGCYTPHFLKITQKITAASFLRKKIFLLLLSAAHCCAPHKWVVIRGTGLWLFPAHFCCNFRHSYTSFLNTYK